MKLLMEHIKLKATTYKIVAGAVVIGLVFVWTGTRNNSFAVTVDGDIVAVVKTKEEATAAVEEVVKHIKTEEGVAITVNEKIAVAPKNSKTTEIQTIDEVKETISSVISYQVEAYEMVIDGKVRAVVESEAVANEILTEIAQMHLPGTGQVALKVAKLETEETPVPDTQTSTNDAAESDTAANESTSTTQVPENTTGEEEIQIADAMPVPNVEAQVNVEQFAVENEEAAKEQKVKREITVLDFNESVVIRNAYVNREDVLGKQEALDVLLGNDQAVLEYELKEGDNIWDVAMTHGTTMDHILEINPQIEDERRMQIGDKIKLEIPDPILSITTTEQATFNELIPADIEYVEFSDLYKDETKVYQEGYDGLKEITVNVHKINGKEVSRDLISENVLKKPKTKVMAYGTKEKPKPEPKPEESQTSKPSNGGSSVKPSNSGSFMHPLNGAGRISSHYGSRGGGFHRGIDIAASRGTPIYAAASGTVTYSGYNSGGFGKLIIIDHGNGNQTYYAHCNSLYAQVGQKVSKGQNIASVGSTGNSSGNHIHFEIRKNGNPVNPYSYIY